MSEPVELGLDLDKLFLPAWAQKSTSEKYANFEGEDRPRSRQGFGGPGGNRPPRRDGPGRGPGGPSTGFGGGPRPARQGGAPDRSPRGPQRDRPGFSAGGAAGLRWERAGGPRRDREPRREEPREQLPRIDVDIRPEPNGVQSLARQIKLSGRAYPLLEVAGLVMQKPDRYEVTFRTIKDADGKLLQPLFECSLDNSIWLDETEATKHVLKAHFDTFYQAEKIAADPPKGVWTLVAQCGMSGEVLGPPNYHGYQEKIRQIHGERFSRMPIDAYKARIKFVKDEAIVKQWIEGQSFKAEYTTLNVPEPRKLNTLSEVEAHFNEVHRANVIRQVDRWTLKAGEAQPRMPQPLFALMRLTIDKEHRFPIKTATALSGQFAHAGLQFFKRDKVVVHVSVARPTYLDIETTPVRDGIRRIVDFINAHPKCTRKQLLDALAPSTAPAPASVPAPVPAAPEAAEPAAVAAGTEPAATAAAPAAPALSPEQQAVHGDLHWLVHQGHVIEFANGILETAKKPLPRPESPKQERAPKAASSQPARQSEKGQRTPGLPRAWRKQIGLLPLPAAQPALVGL